MFCVRPSDVVKEKVEAFVVMQRYCWMLYKNPVYKFLCSAGNNCFYSQNIRSFKSSRWLDILEIGPDIIY